MPFRCPELPHRHPDPGQSPIAILVRTLLALCAAVEQLHGTVTAHRPGQTLDRLQTRRSTAAAAPDRHDLAVLCGHFNIQPPLASANDDPDHESRRRTWSVRDRLSPEDIRKPVDLFLAGARHRVGSHRLIA
jgi:hypothetical protein